MRNMNATEHFGKMQVPFKVDAETITMKKHKKSNVMHFFLNMNSLLIEQLNDVKQRTSYFNITSSCNNITKWLLF